MDYDTQMIGQFANTRESFKRCPATLAALMDFADGNQLALWHDPWIFDALKNRGIVDWPRPLNSSPFVQFTDYGRAFVSWYRSPKDLPAQMSLFGED